jgi:hypothetical protein
VPYVQKDRREIDADGFRERWRSCDNRVHESRDPVATLVLTGKQVQLGSEAGIRAQPGMARLHARIVLEWRSCPRCGNPHARIRPDFFRVIAERVADGRGMGPLERHGQVQPLPARTPVGRKPQQRQRQIEAIRHGG